MIWYRELGFYSNPFSIKPAAFRSEVVGYDLGEILVKIDGAKVLFIEGEYGFGKTTILKHIVSRFGGKRRVVYYNCNRADTTIDAESILKGKYGFIRRIFGGLPRDMILLLDEVEKLSADDQKELLRLHKDGNIKSIVLFGPNFDRVGFSVEMRRRMVNNVIKLTELTDEEAIQLVRERVGALKLLDDRMIKLIFRHSGKNPRIMLENLEDVCKYAVENNEEEVKEEHLKEVLGLAQKAPAPKKARPKAQPIHSEAKAEKKTEKKEEKKAEKKQEKKKAEKRPKEEKIQIQREEKKTREEIKITPLEEDFPPEKPKGSDKKKPEPEFDEGQEPAEGEEESEYFYYY
jgi:Cdc6-like AAA superfamily ATPase